MDSFLIRVVVSRYSVSLGGSLWKTTLEMDDLPLLQRVSDVRREAGSASHAPSLAHEQQTRLAIAGFAVGQAARVETRRHRVRVRDFGIRKVL